MDEVSHGQLVDDYLGLAGKVERLQASDPEEHPDGEVLARWKILYREEISEALRRRDEIVADGPASVTIAELTEWMGYARDLLKVVPVTW